MRSGQIASGGRPKLPAENPSQTSIPLNNAEVENDRIPHLESDQEQDTSIQTTKDETESVQREGANLIAQARLGFLKWNIEHTIQRGYFDKRDVDEEEVEQLAEARQAEDRRHDHSLYAAVDKAELGTLDIHLSEDSKKEPTLTDEQLAGLKTIAITSQHRQMAAQAILTIAKDNYNVSLKALQKLQPDDAVGGKQEGVSGAEGQESSMVQGEAPEEPAAGAEDSTLVVSEETLGERPAGA
ncbi:hypothetical protein FRC00_001362, partial [Tulasnella sp. 408]